MFPFTAQRHPHIMHCSSTAIHLYIQSKHKWTGEFAQSIVWNFSIHRSLNLSACRPNTLKLTPALPNNIQRARRQIDTVLIFVCLLYILRVFCFSLASLCNAMGFLTKLNPTAMHCNLCTHGQILFWMIVIYYHFHHFNSSKDICFLFFTDLFLYFVDCLRPAQFCYKSKTNLNYKENTLLWSWQYVRYDVFFLIIAKQFSISVK